MYFTKKALLEIPRTLSNPRFNSYLNVTSSIGDAIKLYQWNLDLCTAYMNQLHMYEIVLRNAISDAISMQYGADWHLSPGFKQSLDKSNRISLKRAIQSAKIRTPIGVPTIGKVIAEMHFVFWEFMFTSRHDQRIWNSYMPVVFPNSKNLTVQQQRSFLKSITYRVRIVRNRIAHHEPIIDQSKYDHQDISENISKVISWRCAETAKWMTSKNTIINVLAKKP